MQRALELLYDELARGGFLPPLRKRGRHREQDLQRAALMLRGRNISYPLIGKALRQYPNCYDVDSSVNALPKDKRMEYKRFGEYHVKQARKERRRLEDFVGRRDAFCGWSEFQHQMAADLQERFVSDLTAYIGQWMSGIDKRRADVIEKLFDDYYFEVAVMEMIDIERDRYAI